MILVMAVTFAAQGQQTRPAEALLLGADRDLDPSPWRWIRACAQVRTRRATLNTLERV
jgi:hypothetical protein